MEIISVYKNKTPHDDGYQNLVEVWKLVNYVQSNVMLNIFIAQLWEPSIFSLTEREHVIPCNRPTT